MTKATNAANYIFWLEELQPTIRETDENRDIGPGDLKSLHLESLQFSYPMRPHARVLRGIDLHVCQPNLSSFQSCPVVYPLDAIDLSLFAANILYRSKKDNLSHSSAHLAVEKVR
jgi:hypothetical protein